MTATTTAFQVGRTYTCRSIFSFEVVARSAAWITLKSFHGVKRRKVSIYDGVETVSPLGSYSMSPSLRANREA